MAFLNHLNLFTMYDRSLSRALMLTMSGIMVLLIIFYGCSQDLVDFDLCDLGLRVQRCTLSDIRKDISAHSRVNLSIRMVKLITTEIFISGKETIENVRQVSHVFFSGERFNLELLSISLSLDFDNIDVSFRHDAFDIALGLMSDAVMSVLDGNRMLVLLFCLL